MSRWLEGLNEEQTQAVLHTDGPLLVLAGAGSGKTRVITHRIAHLMDHGVAAQNLLAVTFTNKAAGEMRERLGRMVGRDRAEEATLSTFHALGLMILDHEAKLNRRHQRFTIFDTGDQLGVLRDLTRRINLGRAFDLGSILARISGLKNRFVDPTAVPASDDPYDQATALLYPRYEEALEAYAAVDFDDLICRPVRMMESSEDCHQRWTDRFRYILVDEYQDTNAAQLRLLRALAGKRRNVCVVGDDDQAIYGWRGADVRNILEFERDFQGARVVYLMRNYRSVDPVLDLANRVIAGNVQRHGKSLRGSRGKGDQVRLVAARDNESEASWVGSFVHQTLRRGRWNAADIAVLYRSNIVARELEQSMRENGVTYRVLGGTSFFERKEVKDLAAYLRLCVNPNNEISLRRALQAPPRGIGPRTLAKLGAWAEAQHQPLWQAFKQAEQILPATDRAQEPISSFVALVDRFGRRFQQAGDWAAIARALAEESGLHHEIERSSTSGKMLERRQGHLSSLINGLDAYCRRETKRASLAEFLNRLALASSSADNEQADLQRVTLSTLHGAKGLEFPVVVLMGIEEGLLPHDRTLNPHENDVVTTDVAEERRLCYVGITRARDELVLTYARQRSVRGHAKDRQISRFFQGLPEGLFLEEDLSAPPPMEDVQTMMAALRAQLGAE